jgi:hypothetical protein
VVVVLEDKSQVQQTLLGQILFLVVLLLLEAVVEVDGARQPILQLVGQEVLEVVDKPEQVLVVVLLHQVVKEMRVVCLALLAMDQEEVVEEELVQLEVTHQVVQQVHQLEMVALVLPIPSQAHQFTTLEVEEVEFILLELM